eukprot:2591414-Pyramimonas_sp.AAC.1
MRLGGVVETGLGMEKESVRDEQAMGRERERGRGRERERERLPTARVSFVTVRPSCRHRAFARHS